MMNLRRLRYFLRAAAEGSLSKAAQAYGIAQPALTRQMQLLEEEIGVKVFERSSRGMKLTETGQFLKDAIELPLGEIETALKTARHYPRQHKASLTIGFPPQFTGLIGERIIKKLQQQLPNLALRVFEESSSNLASGLSRRLLDVAFLVTTIPDPRVRWMQLLSEPLFLVGGAGSGRSPDLPLALSELQDLPLILPSVPTGLRLLVDQVAAKAGINLNVAMEVHSLELTKQLLQSSHIYSLLPRRAFSGELQEGLLECWPIEEPGLAQSVMWAVKPDWRMPRVVCKELESIVIAELYDAVISGEWPAEWVLDLNTV